MEALTTTKPKEIEEKPVKYKLNLNICTLNSAQDYTCPLCGEYQINHFILKRHVAKHNAPVKRKISFSVKGMWHKLGKKLGGSRSKDAGSTSSNEVRILVSVIMVCRSVFV